MIPTTVRMTDISLYCNILTTRLQEGLQNPVNMMVLKKKKFYITRYAGGHLFSLNLQNKEVLKFNRIGAQIERSNWSTFYDAHMSCGIALLFDGIDAAEAVSEFLKFNISN